MLDESPGDKTHRCNYQRCDAVSAIAPCDDRQSKHENNSSTFEKLNKARWESKRERGTSDRSQQPMSKKARLPVVKSMIAMKRKFTIPAKKNAGCQWSQENKPG